MEAENSRIDGEPTEAQLKEIPTLMTETNESPHAASGKQSNRKKRRPNAESKPATSSLESSGTTAELTAIVLSPADIEADKQALAQFRAVLSDLAQSPTEFQVPSGSLLSRIIHPLGRNIFYRLTSASLFGRSLSFEELVGKYASLLPTLEAPAYRVHSEMALLGLLSLKSGRLSIAQSIFEEVRFLTSTAAALVFVMRGIGRFVVVGALLAFIFYLGLVVAIAILVPFGNGSLVLDVGRSVFGALRDTNVGKVICAMIFGCLGSVVSLLLRLSEFETTKGRSREFLFLSGCTLPLVGGIFAWIIASLLASNFISFEGVKIDSTWLFIVIGFLSGFSERFTRNLLSAAEDGLLPVQARHRRDQRPERKIDYRRHDERLPGD